MPSPHAGFQLVHFFFCHVFVFSLGTGGPAFPYYSCSSQSLNFASGSSFSCPIRTALSSRSGFLHSLVFLFSQSSTLIVFLLHFVLLPSVRLSHASIIKFMKSRLQNILLLKKSGIKFILLLRSVEATRTCRHLLPSVNHTEPWRCCCAVCSPGRCQNMATEFVKKE